MGGLIVLFSAPVFLVSVLGHICVKIWMRPARDSGLDDYYHEFEDQHPDMIRYAKWSRITFLSTAFFALMLFVATAI